MAAMLILSSGLMGLTNGYHAKPADGPLIAAIAKRRRVALACHTLFMGCIARNAEQGLGAPRARSAWI